MNTGQVLARCADLVAHDDGSAKITIERCALRSGDQPAYIVSALRYSGRGPSIRVATDALLSLLKDGARGRADALDRDARDMQERARELRKAAFK